MSPVCVLIGPPGSGKSAVGAALAERLGTEFADTDTEIERRAGKPIPEIFVDHGEAQFRALEAEAVAETLAGHCGVVALGGGAIMTPQTADQLACHRVIYLSVDVATAVRRVGLDTGRPLLRVNPRAQLRHLMEQRRPHYERLATAMVDTQGRTVGEVADVIAGVIGEELGKDQP